ncbi:Asp-tRNA(Asn)/Glu-tRNA(Gln) amidotransferase subunit GatB [Patescibacteria group bacterium]|nr:Asp-tRNA(Asn)/Glu-tRNA(Gln) amidotransferase subunit GatB [Patescibacteria group bacterium]MBU4000374.1 Asp-tRNA(Asn)/Glu-tRNA(Gln) amidotransferase subunit GatB [Patescibacteria group bacterium]MBU4056457.1 Asp-tRNA(Asn)/Glu-tRNA(Gln) amidotransferase subunit GatB [Patescibacteria group bacterium]MBU4368835.1 Asp-tRNA(Asn)/Glu-tRNA(Gln) amidotransferase subunit GatB [Patescibacteria group bacterium]
MADYAAKIGIEAHAELKTDSKMFCGCANNPDEKTPNFNICPICLGHPGTLPVINKNAVGLVLKTAMALNCKINDFSKFDRKNYFYPDLPKGYQISQYDEPLSKEGYLNIIVSNSEASETKTKNQKPKTKNANQNSKIKKIRITRIHLEEDTGKLIHPQGADYSLIDFNRAGAPLMELVTEPDISSGAEAKKFCQELQLIFRYLGVSDAEMEKGQMRCEVNISLGKNGELGTKVEIKNLNSFKAVERSIEYEIKRQAETLKSGGKIIQETRGWDENKGKSFSQRAKEEAHDYRYFPEPDLPPLDLTNDKWSFFAKATDDKRLAEDILPELPAAKRKRFAEEYKLPAQDIEILISDKKLAEYFEETVSELNSWIRDKKLPARDKEYLKMVKLAANYLIGDIQYLLAQTKANISACRLADKISPENFAEFVIIVYEGKISTAAGKIVLFEMFATGGDPSNIIEEKGLAQESGEDALTLAVDEAIKNNPGSVGDYKAGKTQALQFLVGKVMKISKGKANPKIVIELLKKKLG